MFKENWYVLFLELYIFNIYIFMLILYSFWIVMWFIWLWNKIFFGFMYKWLVKFLILIYKYFLVIYLFKKELLFGLVLVIVMGDIYW